MKGYIIAFLFICPLLYAQEKPEAEFVPPFDFPLYLSANFGELRANHFHGGLDIKTQGVVDKPVHSIAEGYVSRITVSSGGYGNALYVTHPNGYMSVYGHLNSFAAGIARYVEDFQYENETFVVDITPDSTLFPVRCGEVIALSGNTGYSFGPHLHMEIRDAVTNEPVDPLVFYRSEFKDSRLPVARSITVYPQKGSGLVGGTDDEKTFRIGNGAGGSCLGTVVEAWGRIAFGLTANDYMDGTSNTYGVRSIALYVDDREVFRSIMNRYSFEESRAINSWTDYAAYKERGTWIMKSFVAPGNPLRFLSADEERGIITIDEERDYHLSYVLEDLYGNVSRYEFVVRGCRWPFPVEEPGVKGHCLRYDQANVVQEPGFQLFFPKGALYEDCVMPVSVRADSSAVSFEYELHGRPVAFHVGCELQIGVRHLPVADTSKYYVQRLVGVKRYSAGGKYEDGWMKATVYETGTYRVAIDTIPPSVTSLKSPSARTLIYKVRDAATGVKAYRGTVDGKFVLTAFDAKSGTLTIRLDGRRVPPGKHSFRLEVEDYCGNVTTVDKLLTY